MNTISPATLEFLTDVAANNNREWFNEHKDRYKAAQANLVDFIEEMIPAIGSFDAGVLAVEPKKCLFRIYRDTRFSKKKEPYKTNLGAVITKGGRRSPYAGYYLHIEPNNSFLAGGMYMPPSPILKQLRAHVEKTAPTLREILADEEFAETFGELRGESLKTAPKGYPKDHPDIDLLRMKGMYVAHEVSDERLLAADFLDEAIDVFHCMSKLNHYLNESIAD